MVSALLVARNSSTAVFVAGIEREFTVQNVTGSDAPDPQTITARGDFSVAVQRLLEHELRPPLDRTGHRVAAMVDIDRSQSVLLRQNVGDAITVSGLHSGERGAVIRPGAWDPLRWRVAPARRHEGRLLPTTARLRRPAPYRPLRPLEQRRQRARQLRQIGLMRCGLRGNRVVAHCAVPSKGAAAGCAAAHRSPSLLYHFKTGSHRSARRPAQPSDEFRIRLELRISRPAEVVLPRHHFRTGDAGCVGGAAAAACFGGGMRTRSAGPILPRMSTIVGNTAMTLSAQPAVSSPKAPRKVRLLVLLSGKPRSSLVNQTINFVSFCPCRRRAPPMSRS